MLNNVGFKVKTLVRSGDTDKESIALLGGTLLGYGWNPSDDNLCVKIKFNISKKCKGIRSGNDLTIESLKEHKGKPLTRKILMGLTNSIFDPLGVASPFTIRLKIAMKKINNTYICSIL